MMRFPRAGFTLVGLLVAFVATWGCGGNADTGQSGPGGFQASGPGPGGGGPGGGGPGGGSPIRQLMTKLDRGPNSLNTIAGALKADPPPWDMIQPLTAEYARLAADLGKLDPPQGSKESWAKLTAAYADSATALDKAAQSKDSAAAQGAETKLRGSCMECHKTHRGGPGGPGGGRGGPGGRRPGGSPPGGG